MKNIILIAILIFTFSMQAQQKERRSKHDQFSPEEMATLQSKKMTLNLDLTASQQKEVQQLLLKKIKAREANKDVRNKRETKPTKEERYERMNAGLDQKIKTKAEFKSVLSEAQFEKWEKSLDKKRKKSKRKPKK